MICPKYGKSSRNIDKCGAPGGRCNEMHTARTCRIKPEPVKKTEPPFGFL